MPSPSPAKANAARPREWSPLAGLLSYLVPGLGQIYQGRVSKGLLFMVCLLGMFFYGMALGAWKNVFLPDTARQANPWSLPTPAANLYNRPQFIGQFWIGIAAWPAIYQYNTADKGTLFGAFQRTPADESVVNDLQRADDKTWDLGWVCTVIAGVLNILVIYDAVAGPAFEVGPEEGRLQKEPNPT
jgi:hypothetical protein